MKDFNFQLFGVLRGSTLGFDGSPSWYLTFYSNLFGRGVRQRSNKGIEAMRGINDLMMGSHGKCHAGKVTEGNRH